MKLLLALTYYKPNVSGLTIYVERLAHGLVARGHDVTILASQHTKELPLDETRDGIRIVRAPVAAKLNKGVVMPSLGRIASTLMDDADLVNLHLPMLDAAGLAIRSRLTKTPLVLTYHCDLQLPPGFTNRAIDEAVNASNFAAAKIADTIVAYTDDYAQHSRLLMRFPGKIAIVPPPVIMRSPLPNEVEAFRSRHKLQNRVVLGFASRFAAEKGIEVLVNALPALIQQHPNLSVLFAGPHEDVIGESEYRARLAPQIAALGDRWKFLGTLDSEELPAFYGALDVLLMTSLNSTESFGLVQVEAMLCGTPVIATDLPGVRQPVLTTGMGKIVPAGDSNALSDAILELLTSSDEFSRPRQYVEELYDLDQSVGKTEAVFKWVIAKRNGSSDEPRSPGKTSISK